MRGRREEQIVGVEGKTEGRGRRMGWREGEGKGFLELKKRTRRWELDSQGFSEFMISQSQFHCCYTSFFWFENTPDYAKGCKEKRILIILGDKQHKMPRSCASVCIYIWVNSKFSHLCFSLQSFKYYYMLNNVTVTCFNGVTTIWGGMPTSPVGFYWG